MEDGSVDPQILTQSTELAAQLDILARTIELVLCGYLISMLAPKDTDESVKSSR